MAVLFAKAMGCGVTVLSSATSSLDSKARDAFELGADEVRSLSDSTITMRKDSNGEVASHDTTDPDVDSAINILLICANETPDFEKILPLLARRAVIVLMSIQMKALNIPYMSFILPGHRLISSTEASTKNHLEMIKFAARHQIKPWVEEFPMTEEGLEEAFDKLESGQMRFRGVVKVP